MDEDTTSSFPMPWERNRVRKGPASSSSTLDKGPAKPGSKRRSSILKLKPSPPAAAGKPLQELNGRAAKESSTAAAEDKKKSSRRSLKRVSFSASRQVKEFQAGQETLTLWNNTYEDEDQHQHSSNNASAAGPLQQPAAPRSEQDLDDDPTLNKRARTGEAPASSSSAISFLSELASSSSSSAAAATDLNTSLNRGATSRMEHLFNYQRGETGGKGEDLEKSLFVTEDDEDVADHTRGSDAMEITRHVTGMEERHSSNRSAAPPQLPLMNHTRLAGAGGGDLSSFMDMTMASTATAVSSASDRANDSNSLFTCDKTLSAVLGEAQPMVGEDNGEAAEMEMTGTVPRQENVKKTLVQGVSDVDGMEMTRPVPPSAALSKKVHSASSAAAVSDNCEEKTDNLMEMTKPVPSAALLKKSATASVDESSDILGDQPMEMTKSVPASSVLRKRHNHSSGTDPATDEETTSTEQTMEMTKPVPASAMLRKSSITSTAINIGPVDENNTEQLMEMTRPVPTSSSRQEQPSSAVHRSRQPSSESDTMEMTGTVPPSLNAVAAQCPAKTSEDDQAEMMEMTKPVAPLSLQQTTTSNAKSADKSPPEKPDDSPEDDGMELTKAVPSSSLKEQSSSPDSEHVAKVASPKESSSATATKTAAVIEETEEQPDQDDSVMEMTKPVLSAKAMSNSAPAEEVAESGENGAVAEVEESEDDEISMTFPVPASALRRESVAPSSTSLLSATEMASELIVEGEDDKEEAAEQSHPDSGTEPAVNPSVSKPPEDQEPEESDEKQHQGLLDSISPPKKLESDCMEEEEVTHEDVADEDGTVINDVKGAVGEAKNINEIDLIPSKEKCKKKEEESCAKTRTPPSPPPPEDDVMELTEALPEAETPPPLSPTPPPPPPPPPRRLSVFEYLEETSPSVPSWRPGGGGRWRLEESSEWRAQVSFLHGALLLNVSLGHARTEDEVGQIGEGDNSETVHVRHWSVSSVECVRSSSTSSSVSPEASLALRLLCRGGTLSPARLQQWCPSTDKIAETIRRISLSAEEAGAFVLSLHRVGGSHAPFKVNASEQRLTVGFSSLRRPTFQFSAAVDFSKGMDNVHRAVEVKWQTSGPDTLRLRDEVESAVLELASTSPAGWGFVEAFVGKVDLYLEELKQRIRKKEDCN